MVDPKSRKSSLGLVRGKHPTWILNAHLGPSVKGTTYLADEVATRQICVSESEKPRIHLRQGISVDVKVGMTKGAHERKQQQF